MIEMSLRNIYPIVDRNSPITKSKHEWFLNRTEEKREPLGVQYNSKCIDKVLDDEVTNAFVTICALPLKRHRIHLLARKRINETMNTFNFSTS